MDIDPKFHGLWLLMVLLLLFDVSKGQQSYVANHQLACYDDRYNYTTKGYLCNAVQPSCHSYLTFRSNPPYNSAVYIQYLLQSDATLITSLNNISSDVATIPTNTQVIVPVNCSCSGDYFQHNATYTLKGEGETYFSVSNNTYQGLTTCQAMMAQNPYGDRNLSVHENLLVPLRCACPTSNQTAKGFKYLLTYMVTWDDTVSAIAESFNVDVQSVLDANELKEKDLIFPFTPLLVPLTTEPNKIESPVVSPPPPAAESPEMPVGGGGSTTSSNSKKWVFVGVGIGAALFILVALSGFLFCFRRRQPSNKDKPVSASAPKTTPTDSVDYTTIPENKSWSVSVSSQGLQYAVESLTVYKFEDLQIATDYFGEANRIKGSVYRGSFKGDAAAVKVMKGDVSSEINLLKMINHSNIIRLSGFCVHQGNTYLVYEYADKGSLSDWLHSKKYQSSVTLAWKQRVQIAYNMADALNYLHNFTNPPYIHKNLKASNILLDGNLDGNFRAKLANFGLARMVDNDDQGGLQLTRHVVGTHCYMAPEYIENGVITPKLDVFAFGVVILELLSGRGAAAGDKNAGEELLSAAISRVLEGDNVREKLGGFIDPSLRHEYPLDLAFSMAQLAKLCVAHDLNARPAMPEVLITLSKILSSSLDWDPSDELDRSTSISSGR